MRSGIPNSTVTTLAAGWASQLSPALGNLDECIAEIEASNLDPPLRSYSCRASGVSEQGQARWGLLAAGGADEQRRLYRDTHQENQGFSSYMSRI